MFSKKKSVKKETQKPQNRHYDEDRTAKEKMTKFLLRTLKFSKFSKVEKKNKQNNYEKGQMLFLGRLTNNHKDNSTFCHGNPRIEEPANEKEISLRQIRILRNLRHFRAHSRQLRSSYKRGLNIDQLSKIIAGKV